MNLNYSVLWIDDQLTAIEGSKEEIEAYIEEQGYEPDILLVNPMRESDLNSAIQNKKWNLIIVDYNLTDQLDGKQLIQKIRDLGLVASIIFYSADALKVDEEIRKSSLEGVYWASRGEELEETIQNIIDYTLKIVMNVNSMRGLVMAEVAEMDHDMEDIIRFHYSTIDQQKQVSLLNKILNKVEGSAKGNRKLLENARVEGSIDACLDWRIIDSDKRRRTTENILGICNIDGNKVDELKKCRSILGKRNILAHGRTTIKDGQEIIKYKKNEFSLKEALDLRNELRKQRKNFKELKNEIKNIKQ